MKTSDPILSTLEAAEFLGVAVQTLAVWRCRGGGPAFIRLSSTGRGGRVGYRASDLESWLSERRAFSTSEEAVARDSHPEGHSR